MLENGIRRVSGRAAQNESKEKNENLGKYLGMRSKLALQAYLYEQEMSGADISLVTLDLLRAGVELGKKSGREGVHYEYDLAEPAGVRVRLRPNLGRPAKVRLRPEMRRRAL
jgi:hypothetical protein